LIDVSEKLPASIFRFTLNMEASSSPELSLGCRHQVSKGYLEDECRRPFQSILKTGGKLL
jgi:hypothetical protein